MNIESRDDAGVIIAQDNLKSILINGETVTCWSIQRRVFSLFSRRIFIAATSSRFIVITRGLFGGFSINDYRWQDVGDVKLNVGIFGADLNVKVFAKSDLSTGATSQDFISLKGFRKSETQEIYRIIQENDFTWREIRRVRDLEELRAKSGGVIMGNGYNSFSQNINPNITKNLDHLKSLLDTGQINDSEYSTMKAKIMNGNMF